jgi:hypothetical protein
MKLPNSVEIRKTIRLFHGKYKYKVVIRTALASWFRGNNLDHVLKCLADPMRMTFKVPTNSELLVGKKLHAILENSEDIVCRVEHPFLSIYTNSEKDVKQLVNIDIDNIKYVSVPDVNSEKQLLDGKLIVKRLDYEYRVVMGSCNQNQSSFVEWSTNNPKIRLPKRAKKDLSKNWSRGGSHFYVKDSKSLTIVKMFLGSFITKIEAVSQV